MRQTIKKEKKLKGLTASQGIVEGKAKIILDFKKDLPKMNKGNILITDETDPTILPLILKAKAIVTDSGGLLCHAAIVSRELGIPCVTGTKMASRIFKDNDFIEVDGTKGIVRLILFKNKKKGQKKG